VTGRWYAEYQFCSVFGRSHDEFMDTPLEVIEWMLRIHNEVTKAENNAAKGGSGG